ncbi:MAG TPA: sensor domain-containing diguanylate cyclase, partial [Patescibacteria group bacterium]|nr:sensor domain-containing diguanylate cyclase [Patescibacteria group bacterium]
APPPRPAPAPPPRRPTARPAAAPPTDPLAARTRLGWTLLAAAIAALAALVVAWIVLPALPLALPVALAVAAVAGAAAFARHAVERREAGTREEVENYARILQGFSRAVSPDAIVEAIMGELGPGTEADHLVVVRRRPGAPILDATLVPTRPGAPRAEAVLPAVDLDDPGGAPEEWIAIRVRRAFGLTNVLAAPLTAHGELLGAILVSQRRAGPWSDALRRLLEAAATEASAALARTETHRAAEAAATTDALTGLPNRRYFEEYVALLGRGRRVDDAVGVLMVDVDRFKLLNDRHGHATGDVVLRAVARTIAAAVRDVDLPARYGGEEFVVLLRNPSRAVVLEVGERIREAVERLDLSAAGVEKVTVSVGATVGDGGAERVPDLVKAADRALYRAKRFGRNRVEAG